MIFVNYAYNALYSLGQQHSHLQHCSSNANGDVTRSMRQPCLLGNVSCYNLFKCLHVARGNCSECTCFWSHEWKNINHQNDAHRFAISLYYKVLLYSTLVLNWTFSGFPLNIISLLVTMTAIETWGTAMFDLNQYREKNGTEWVDVNCSTTSTS